jgi:uncharacterized membrane protein
MAFTFAQRIGLYAPSTAITPNLVWGERLVSLSLGTKITVAGIASLFTSPIRGLVEAAAGGYLLFRGITGVCPVYKSIGTSIHITHILTVNKAKQEVYQFWRNLENLPLFMKHLASVVEKDAKNSYWVARIPGNLAKIGWEAQITRDEPGKLISWKSLKGSTVDNEGHVSFSDAPDGKGTLINVVIAYKSPVAGTGEGLAKLFTPVFEMMIRDDIENFKTYIESGEVSPNP